MKLSKKFDHKTLLVISVVLVIFGLIFGFFLFPKFLRHTIKSVSDFLLVLILDFICFGFSWVQSFVPLLLYVPSMLSYLKGWNIFSWKWYFNEFILAIQYISSILLILDHVKEKKILQNFMKRNLLCVNNGNVIFSVLIWLKHHFPKFIELKNFKLFGVFFVQMPQLIFLCILLVRQNAH